MTHSSTSLDNKRGKVFSGFNKVSTGQYEREEKKDRAKPQHFTLKHSLDPLKTIG